MKTITRRIARLEDQLGTVDRKPWLLLVVSKVGWGLALDQDTCLQMLRECRSLPTGPVGLVNLCGIQDGLNAAGMESFLRRRGAEVCFPQCSTSSARRYRGS